MSKLLIIGGGGLNSVIKMKEVGIPNARYISFGTYDDKDPAAHGITCYNLRKMNGEDYASCPNNVPEDFKNIAKMLKNKLGKLYKIIYMKMMI